MCVLRTLPRTCSRWPIFWSVQCAWAHCMIVVRYSMFWWSLNHLLKIYFFRSVFNCIFRFDGLVRLLSSFHSFRRSAQFYTHITYVCRLTELWQRVPSTCCNIFPTSGVQIYQFVMSDQTKRIKKKIKERNELRTQRRWSDEKENRRNGMRLKWRIERSTNYRFVCFFCIEEDVSALYCWPAINVPSPLPCVRVHIADSQ